MNIGTLAASLFGGTVIGWLVGRLHLRKTQLKALDNSVHLPVGTLEDKANAAAEAAAVLAAQKVGKLSL